jgi:phage-related protein (TIGR01555 family)
MDLFRAQDAATKRAIRNLTQDGYENCISKLGLNQDNALSGGTYDFDLVTRNRLLLEMAYRGSWMTGVVVDSVAEDMTRAGAEITTSEAESDLPKFKESFTRFRIWQSLAELISWGRLYGGALGVMQIEGQNLDTPLDVRTVGPGQFKGVVNFDRWMLSPVLNPVIESGPQMGLPNYYQIVSSPDAADPTAKSGMVIVHHSRCFRHIGVKLPFFQAITEMMWGMSVLERLWDRLIAFDNATMSAAQLIDRANLRTVKLDGLREISAAGGEALDGLKAQFELMRLAQTNEGLTLLDKNDEFDSVSYTFSGIPETLLQLGQQLAGAAGVPLVRLFGQSPAGLNATGEADIRMYYDNIKAQQEATLREPFDTLLKVMWASEFGRPAPADLGFQFTPLWQMDAKDKAEIAKTNTDTIVQAHQDGLLTTPAAMKELRAQAPQTGLFANITDEDITEAELEPPPMPDAPSDTKPEEVTEEVTQDSATKDYIREENGKFCVYSESGKRLGEYATRAEAEKRLRQVEYFKSRDSRWQRWLAWFR